MFMKILNTFVVIYLMLTMKYVEIIQLLREGLGDSEPPHKSIAFFRSDKVSMIVWLVILNSHYQKEKCNTESIFLNIPSHLASRPTVYKHIDNATSKGYVIKKQNEDDHRIFNLYPSDITISEFEGWVNKFTFVS